MTQAEQGLLTRVVPFIKIVKLSGQFGQFGFKGQAILFAKDIFEVIEQLPKMLPRSSSDTSVVVVTENLENVDRVRQFTIDRDRVYRALHWLIENNPLYSDVTVDKNADLNLENIIRSVSLIPQAPLAEQNNRYMGTKYKEISRFASILYASRNQADKVKILFFFVNIIF